MNNFPDPIAVSEATSPLTNLLPGFNLGWVLVVALGVALLMLGIWRQSKKTR